MKPSFLLASGVAALLAFHAMAQEEQVGLTPKPDLPVAENSAAAPVPAPPENPAPPATPAVAETPSGPRFGSINWGGSIMFKPEEMNNLRLMLDAFDRRANGGEDYLSEILDSTPVEGTEAQKPPQFFLDSIVYFSPENWTVWVNGKKIDPINMEEKDTLKVEKISKTAAQFTWKPLSIVDAKSALEQKKSYPSTNIKSASLQQVEVDDQKGIVRFTLRPNQTFDSVSMEVVEGRATAAQNPVADIMKPDIPVAAPGTAPVTKPFTVPAPGAAIPPGTRASPALSPQGAVKSPVTPAPSPPNTQVPLTKK